MQLEQFTCARQPALAGSDRLSKRVFDHRLSRVRTFDDVAVRQLCCSAGPRRVPALERRAQRLERRRRSVPPQRLNSSNDDVGVGVVEIGDRAHLDNRRHPHVRDLVEKSPAAGGARRHRTIEQRGACGLVDTQEISDDRGLLTARHPADLVVGAR